MFEHSTFIIASYGAATLIMAWCALSPLFRTRKIRAQLSRMLQRLRMEDGR